MAYKNYELYTIDVDKLLKRCEIEQDKVNHNHYFKYKFSVADIMDADVISNTISQQTNAMFDQIRMICSKNDDYDIFHQKGGSDNFMLDKLVRLNFKNYFSYDKNYESKDIIDMLDSIKSKQNFSKAEFSNTYKLFDKKRNDALVKEQAYKLLSLFTKGFDMTMPNHTVAHMVPFEKTASLSREMQMFFVNEKLLPYYGPNNQEVIDKLKQNGHTELIEYQKKHDIVNRIMLDMELSESNYFKNITPSKYYTYRGLMTSGGKPCKIIKELGKNNGNAPIINEDTFIVINDVACTTKEPVSYIAIAGNDGITADTEIDLSDESRKRYCKTEKYKIGNVYDGQGLCTPDFAERISRQYDGTDKNTCFQFRLPFCKGVLHALDFKGVIKNYFIHNDEKYIKNKIQYETQDEIQDETQDETQNKTQDEMFKRIYIKDAFGIYRNLSKVEVIVTVSQFKFFEFIKAQYSTYTKNEGLSADGAINRNNVDCDDKKNKKYNRDDDPMAKYIDSLHKYGNAFYVLHTNKYKIENNNGDDSSENTQEASEQESCSKKDKSVPFTYQFLMTTPLSNKDLKNLVEDQADQIYNIEDNNIAIDKNGKFDETTRSKTKLVEFLTNDKFIAKNPAMLKLDHFKDTFEFNRRKYLKDIARGRFLVEGSRQFIARDLLWMLLDIIGINSDKSQDSQNHTKLEYLIANNELIDLLEIEQNKENHCKLMENALKEYQFYSANYASNNFSKKGKLFALYRSPHYSRNEIGLLKSYNYNSKITLKNFDNQDVSLNFYYTYCNNYGVTQLPKYSTIADRLGGADFDGDAINLISEEVIVDAICKYFSLGESHYGDAISTRLSNDWLKHFEMQNPFICIQTGKAEKTEIKKTKEYDPSYIMSVLPSTLRSFNNQVGVFSNKVFEIAGFYYSDQNRTYKGRLEEAKKAKDKDKYLDANLMDEKESIPAIGTIINGNLIDYAKTGFIPEKAKGTLLDYLSTKQPMVIHPEDVKENHISINRQQNAQDYFLYLCGKSSILTKQFNFNKALRGYGYIDDGGVDRDNEEKDEKDKTKRYIKINNFSNSKADKIWFYNNSEGKKDFSDGFAKIISYPGLNKKTEGEMYIKDFDDDTLPIYNCPSYFSTYLQALNAKKTKSKIQTLKAKITVDSDKLFDTKGIDKTAYDTKDRILALITAYKFAKKNSSQFNKKVSKADIQKQKKSIQRLLNRKVYTNDKSMLNSVLSPYCEEGQKCDCTMNTIFILIQNLISNAIERLDLDEANNLLNSLTDYSKKGEAKYLLTYKSKYLKDENGDSKTVTNCWIYAGDCPIEDRKNFLDKIFKRVGESRNGNISIAYNLLCDFRDEGAFLLPEIISYTMSFINKSQTTVLDEIVGKSEKYIEKSKNNIDDELPQDDNYGLEALSIKSLRSFTDCYVRGDNDEYDKEFIRHITKLNELFSERVQNRTSESAYNRRVSKYCLNELIEIMKKAEGKQENNNVAETVANGEVSQSDNEKYIEEALKYVYTVSNRGTGNKYYLSNIKNESTSNAIDKSLTFMFDVFPENVIYDAVIDVNDTKGGVKNA